MFVNLEKYGFFFYSKQFAQGKIDLRGATPRFDMINETA